MTKKVPQNKFTLNWKNFKFSFPLKTTFMDKTSDVFILQWSHYNWLTKADCENITYKLLRHIPRPNEHKLKIFEYLPFPKITEKVLNSNILI